MFFQHKNRMTPARIILIGFALLILAGAVLLTLPIATRDGQGAPFLDALFTATSATCVTGLVVQDTSLYWTVFGQAVIILLIQIGGMGVVTAAVTLSMLAGRKIGLKERWVMQESISAPQVGGIVRRTRFILAATFLMEGIGALLLEHKERPGRKLGITGKGRCNLTNHAGMEQIIAAFPRGGRFLYSAVSRFTPEDVMNGIESGIVYGTIAQNTFAHGYIPFEILRLMNEEGYTKVEGTYFIDSGCVLVTKDNIDTFNDDLQGVTDQIIADLTTVYLTK